jgi:hypothetical protein
MPRVRRRLGIKGRCRWNSHRQSPAASAADVSSQTLGAGATAASEAEKGGASDAQPVGGHRDNICMSAPWPTLEQQIAKSGRPGLDNDNDRCLYVGTPWENDVIADHRDIDNFKKVPRTIAWTLSVRAWCFCCDSLTSALVIFEALM